MLYPLIFINYFHSLLLATIYPILLTADLFTSCPVTFSFHTLNCSPLCLGVSWLIWIYFKKIKSECYSTICPCILWQQVPPGLESLGWSYQILPLLFMELQHFDAKKLLFFTCINLFLKQEYRENFRASREEAEVIKV